MCRRPGCCGRLLVRMDSSYKRGLLGLTRWYGCGGRLIAYMADDPSLTYTYSSLRLTPSAWTPAARQVKVRT